MTSKSAFTIIELIFVIVIIGILASIAMRMLYYTRDVAKVTTIVTNTQNILKDVESYYVSKAEANYKNAKVFEITNVPLYTNNSCTISANNSAFKGSTLYLCDDTADVLKITSSTNTPYSITLTQGSSTSAVNNSLTKNKAFQALTNGTSGKTYTIGGSLVNQ